MAPYNSQHHEIERIRETKYTNEVEQLEFILGKQSSTTVTTKTVDMQWYLGREIEDIQANTPTVVYIRVVYRCSKSHNRRLKWVPSQIAIYHIHSSHNDVKITTNLQEIIQSKKKTKSIAHNIK